jgi:hypothetical protein
MSAALSSPLFYRWKPLKDRSGLALSGGNWRTLSGRPPPRPPRIINRIVSTEIFTRVRHILSCGPGGDDVCAQVEVVVQGESQLDQLRRVGTSADDETWR